MKALATQNLSLLSCAPNGLKKLRQLILTLAVQGRLVPQDRSEQPAAEFLSRIAAHKADAAARGRSRRPVEVPEPAESAAAATAPAGWLWTTFGSATVCRDGERIPVSQVDRERRRKLYDYYGASGVIDKIDGYLFDKPLLLIGEDGANLVNRSSPIAFIARGQYWVNNHAHVIDGVTEGLLRYLELYINALDLKPYVTGTAQPKMNQAKLNSIPLALPPEAEQHRIVAKVDEMMSLCDRLEAEQAGAEAAHAQLVQALLASLTQGRDSSDLRASWQQLAEHFHMLFVNEASVNTLEEAILELAVSGRLTAQHQTDGTSDGLIAEIDEHRARSVAEAGLRAKNARSDIPLAEQYLKVPANWRYCRLGSLARFIDYRGKTPVKTISGVPLITAKNVRFGYVSREPREFIASEGYAPWMTRGIPRPGDMLFTTEAPLGNIAIIDIAERFALAQRVICFQLYLMHTGPFLRIALMSKSVQAAIAEMATGMTATGVKASKLKELPIPLPPLAEQQRIVATVEKLVELCSRLKTEVATARLNHEHLARVLIEQVVA